MNNSTTREHDDHELDALTDALLWLNVNNPEAPRPWHPPSGMNDAEFIAYMRASLKGDA
jgi:hypothetical protein